MDFTVHQKTATRTRSGFQFHHVLYVCLQSKWLAPNMWFSKCTYNLLFLFAWIWFPAVQHVLQGCDDKSWLFKVKSWMRWKCVVMSCPAPTTAEWTCVHVTSLWISLLILFVEKMPVRSGFHRDRNISAQWRDDCMLILESLQFSFGCVSVPVDCRGRWVTC